MKDKHISIGRHMTESFLDEIEDALSDEEKRLIEKQIDIAVQVDESIKRLDITKQEFASRMGWKPSYLSRVLAGDSNLTLKTIARLEIVLGEEIITTPKGTEYGLESAASVWIAEESSIHERPGYAAFTIAGDPLTGPALVDLTGAVSVNVGMEMKLEGEPEKEERGGYLPIIQYQHDFPHEMPLA